MTNEELAAEIAAIAGRLGDLAVRLSAPREPLVETPIELPPLFDESLSNEALQPKPNAIITLEVLRAALTDLTTAKGAATTKQLLAEYEAKKLSDVPVDRYASLMADAKAWASE